MKKILVTVFVLCIGEKFDLFLPIDMKMIDAIGLIQKSVYELSNEEYIIKPDKNVILYDSNGKVINTNNIIKFSGLKNGSHILLV
ncbi:MAG: hypothetical protein IJI43_00810 [Bacilli bacterium]|nr:hypothetical protein [Bacilli bacterium]